MSLPPSLHLPCPHSPTLHMCPHHTSNDVNSNNRRQPQLEGLNPSTGVQGPATTGSMPHLEPSRSLEGAAHPPRRILQQADVLALPKWCAPPARATASAGLVRHTETI